MVYKQAVDNLVDKFGVSTGCSAALSTIRGA